MMTPKDHRRAVEAMLESGEISDINTIAIVHAILATLHPPGAPLYPSGGTDPDED